MICPYCDSENPEGSEYCSACHAALSSAPFAAPAEQPAAFTGQPAPTAQIAPPAEQAPTQQIPAPQSIPQQPPMGQQQPPIGQQPPMGQGYYPQQPMQPVAEKWYAKTWVIVLFLIFFWPVGIVLMWKKTCSWTKVVKIVITIIIAIWFAFSMINLVNSIKALSSVVSQTPTTGTSTGTNTGTNAGKSTGTNTDTNAGKSTGTNTDKGTGTSTDTNKGGSAGTTGGGTSSTKFDAECLDSYGNITLYALSELSGSELKTLMTQQGYAWDTGYVGYVNAKTFAAVAASNASGELNADAMAKVAKGGLGSKIMYFLDVDGYSTPAAALKGANKVVTEHSYTYDSQTELAVCYGPSMNRYLIIAQPNDDGTQGMRVYSQEAIASGLFNQTEGGTYGTSIDEIWLQLTGQSI